MAAVFADAVQRHDPQPRLTLVDRIGAALTRAWRAGHLPEPSLDERDLVASAARKERDEPEGGHWEDSLAVLTRDLREQAALNPLGRAIAHGQLVRVLRHRIRAERLWRRRPEILDASLSAPVIILGHMRSGTTRLHRLMACDRRFAFTRMHESLQPLSRWRAGAALTTAALDRFMNACNPHLRHVHPSAAGAPEEEFGLHAFSLHGAMFEAQWWVPSFARWSERPDTRLVYREFRALLQTLRWRRRDPAGAIQLLKAPQFMQDLHEVRRAFPDARFIRMERDATDLVASGASLVWNQQRVQSDHADPIRIGSEWRRKTALREARARAVIDRLPTAQYLTVSFDAMDRDWRTEIARIYEFLGMPLDDALLQRMARVIGESRHKGHRYAPERFGLPARPAQAQVA